MTGLANSRALPAGPVVYFTLADLKTYLRLGTQDTVDDVLLQRIVEAVTNEQLLRLMATTFVAIEPPTEEGQPNYTVPSDVFLAALMRGARLYARRASPEGLVGLGELGVARVPPYDRDIDALEAPWRNVVLA